MRFDLSSLTQHIRRPSLSCFVLHNEATDVAGDKSPEVKNSPTAVGHPQPPVRSKFQKPKKDKKTVTIGGHIRSRSALPFSPASPSFRNPSPDARSVRSSPACGKETPFDARSPPPPLRSTHKRRENSKEECRKTPPRVQWSDIGRSPNSSPSSGQTSLLRSPESRLRPQSYGNVLRDSGDAHPPSPPATLKQKHVVGHVGRDYGYGNVVRRETRGQVGENVWPEKAEELSKAGNGKYRRGCYEEALAFYVEAAALWPTSAACHNNKAAALMALGRLTEAAEECMQAIKYKPSCPRAHGRLRTLHQRLDGRDESGMLLVGESRKVTEIII